MAMTKRQKTILAATQPGKAYPIEEALKILKDNSKAKFVEAIDVAVRLGYTGYIGNDAYAMQNLMESFVKFQPLTPNLHEIKVPTLIMNGEFDFFTPRECHELIRSKVANSRLLIIQHAYHAFTLEMPAVTMRQIEVFLEQVSGETWAGDQSVWIASDNPQAAEQWLPCSGDWMRAIQVAAPSKAQPKTPARTSPATVRKTVTRKTSS